MPRRVGRLTALVVAPLIAATSLSTPAAAWVAGAAQVAAAPYTRSQQAQIDVVFASAATRAALIRVHDEETRRLLARIETLEAEKKRAGGRADALRDEIARLKAQMIETLAARDRVFAGQRKQFVQAISGLFETTDPNVEALLVRYAGGDTAALDALMDYFKRGNRSGPERIIDQRGYAALVMDAYQKDRRAIDEEVRAKEAILAADSTDFDAWYNLALLYRKQGENAKAQAAASHLAENARFELEAYQARYAAGMTALDNDDFLVAQRELELADRLAAGIYDANMVEAEQMNKEGKLAASSPEALLNVYYAITNARQYSFSTLRLLPLAYAGTGRFEDARVAARRALRDCDTVRELTRQRKKDSSDSECGVTTWRVMGDVEMAAGAPDKAASAYASALAAMRRDYPKTPPLEPLALFTRAALLGGDRAGAETALAETRSLLNAQASTDYTFWLEGLYWEQVGEVSLVDGQREAALRALASSEAAAAQAVALKPNDPDYIKALARISRRKAGLTAP